MSLHFEEVYVKSDPGDEFLAGFQLAKDFPDHKIKLLVVAGEEAVMMVYKDEPTVEQIVAGLKEQKMGHFVEPYLEDVNDQLNDEVDDMLHNH